MPTEDTTASAAARSKRLVLAVVELQSSMLRDAEVQRALTGVGIDDREEVIYGLVGDALRARGLSDADVELGLREYSSSLRFTLEQLRGQLNKGRTKGRARDNKGSAEARDADALNADALDADAAAAFLGVKKQTLYIYVSRGLIRTVRRPGGNLRGYLREDLARVKARSDARAGRAPSAIGALHYGEPVIESAITLIDVEKGPIYRGHVAVELARRGVTREQIARLLWSGALPEAAAPQGKSAAFTPSHAKLARFKLVLDAKSPLEQIEAALFLIGRELPRYAMPDEQTLAERVVGTVYALLAELGIEASPALHRVFAVLADHELNPSTFAARVAASTGAGLVQCLQAALAVFSGPRHGGACDRIDALLDEVQKPGRAHDVVAGRLQRGEEVPGFFSGIYRSTDPRSAALFELPGCEKPGAATARAVVDAMASLGGSDAPGPSVDLALVALARGLAWPKGAATAVFAAARMSGWIAHVFEQRESRDVLRPRARFKAKR